jgi:general secretion pathway protein A
MNPSEMCRAELHFRWVDQVEQFFEAGLNVPENVKTPIMYLLTPGIETYAAYATCLLLFGLLFLSVKNRKMAAKSQRAFYRSPTVGISRPALGSKPVQGLRRTPTPVQHSRLRLSTVLEFIPREPANIKPPENSTKELAVPPDFTAAQIQDEVKMDSASFSSVKLDPIAPSETFAFAAPEKASTIQECIPASPAGYGHFEIDEQSAQVSAIGPKPPVADQSAMEPVAIAPQVPPVEATCEKTAPANLLEFCGLQQQPFDVTPDPAFLYFSPSHREALTALKQGIENFRGFMMLIAEPGMGKTTLLNKLMEELSESARVIFLFQTQCSPKDLLCYILNELEVDHAGMDIVAMHRALNQALLEEMLRGRRFVLIVDEAQNLQEPVLETIRLLSDFETTHSKLIQIVLAGQPPLADTLMRPGLVQLRQRVAVLTSLKSLTPTETAEYIEFRLRAAGWKDKLLFSSEALDEIAESSEGVPRRINNLSFNALSMAFDRGQEFVDSDMVKEVVGKLSLESFARRPEMEAAAPQPVAPVETIGATQLARALAAALAAEARPDVSAEPVMVPKAKPDVHLTGNLTEKVRSQGWSKQHEYRILVSLERDPISGLPVADRYYCCSLYVDEKQAAGLKAGKPVRIKIEQD